MFAEPSSTDQHNIDNDNNQYWQVATVVGTPHSLLALAYRRYSL